MAFADNQLSYLERSTLLLLPGFPVCPSHRESLWKKSWISGLYQNKCIWGSQINIVWGIIVLCFLNFKCLTLHLINIHSVFFFFYISLWEALGCWLRTMSSPEETCRLLGNILICSRSHFTYHHWFWKPVTLKQSCKSFQHVKTHSDVQVHVCMPCLKQRCTFYVKQMTT